MSLIIDEEITLSKLQPEDAEDLALNADDTEVSSTLRDLFPSPYSVKDAQDFIKSVEKLNVIVLAIRSNAKVIGVIGVKPGKDVNRYEAEIGYWIGRKYWGRGIVSKCVRAYVEYVFENTSFVRIYANVFETNPASMRVLEKCGFEKEGVLRKSVYKNGKYLDSVIYARIKEVES